jgi:hypothetical protein
MYITLVFRKTPFFRRKLAKIAENCDHNIDPSLAETEIRKIDTLADSSSSKCRLGDLPHTSCAPLSEISSLCARLRSRTRLISPVFYRAGAGLYSAGSGFCGPGLVGGLGVWPVKCGLGLLRARPGWRARGLACGLSPKTGPERAQAWARSGPSFLVPSWPTLW